MSGTKHQREGFVIRISKDGAPDIYVRGSRRELVVFQRMSAALDEIQRLRPSLMSGQEPAVVPYEHVPRVEKVAECSH